MSHEFESINRNEIKEKLNKFAADYNNKSTYKIDSIN